MAVKDARPRYLNLFKIRLPVTGIISIFHRISGILLFLAIPFSLYLIQQSVANPVSFRHVHNLFSQPIFRFILLILIWSMLHHLFTGIRFLLTDLDIGLDKKSSRVTAWTVVATEAVTMALIITGFFL